MSVLRTLTRAFVDQFFTSESVTSDVELQQRVLWLLGVVIAPGVFILIIVFPDFVSIALRAHAGRAPLSLIDDRLEWLTLILTTYAMAGTGFVTVLSWDALTFDRRDAMVLGPLPLGRSAMMAAKLGALGGLLIVGAAPICLLDSTVFAIETSEVLGWRVFAPHLAAMVVATIAASTFIFSAIVAIRAMASLVGGPRLASLLGPVLQFAFVLAILCLVILSPAASARVQFMTSDRADWLPPTWFVGLFEQLRHSPRAGVPHFRTLTHRCLVTMPLVVGVAFLGSLVEFRRQLTATGSATTATPFAARTPRAIARRISGANQSVRAVADFVILTVTRNRIPQASVSIHAGFGAALAVAALSDGVSDIASLEHPRTIVLWIPLVLSYWTLLGMRSSFFVPSELKASWAFRTITGERSEHWAAIRGSMIGMLLGPVLAGTCLLFVPLLGWRVALWHALICSLLLVVLVDILALTVDFIPFTRAQQLSRGNLGIRLACYGFGMYLFAYWPVQLEMWTQFRAISVLGMCAGLCMAIGVLEVLGLRHASRSALHWSDAFADDDSIAGGLLGRL